MSLNPILKLLSLILVVSLLAACGGSDDDAPPPTVASFEELATSNAPITLGPTATLFGNTPVPTEIAALPTETAEPPTNTPTNEPITEQPEVTSEAEPDQFAPITQTVVAIERATQTAAALITPSPTPSETPEVIEPFQVVFYGNRNGNDDIFLMTLNGVERALTGSAANEREPFCSPDGSSVVYVSDETGSFQIYKLALNSTTPVQLTDSEGMNFAPAISPDGSSIAFVSTRNQGIPTIWMMNADGSDQHQITTDLGRDTSPFWGPDSRQLLFASEQSGPWDIFMTVIGEDVQGEFPILPAENSVGNELWPFFDSQGERIVYTVWENLEDPQTADIYLLDFEQPEPIVVRARPGADIAWAWGDETHLLASVGGPDNIQIALVDITTGEAVPLTSAGTFNGGARLCTVEPSILPPEPTPAPTQAPTSTLAPPEASPTPTTSSSASLRLTSNELVPKVALMPDAHDLPAPAEPRSRLFALFQGQPHTVQQGETLIRIGAQYGVSWESILRANGLTNPDRLKIGQRLMVRLSWRGYLELDPNYVPQVKRIVVNLDKQRVYAYEGERLVRTVVVSTGLPATPTVQGEFHIYQKLPSQTMSGPGYYLPGVPYVMYFYQGYGLHGTYWHENFGQPMSHGCVNLPTPEAEWFYTWAEIGTTVQVVRSVSENFRLAWKLPPPE